MNPTRKVKKLETPWQCAVRLAAHFNVAPETVLQWYDIGCPKTFDEAVEWKMTRIEDAKVRAGNAPKAKIDLAMAEAKQAPVEIDFAKLSTEMANLCDIVCDLYLAGLTTGQIRERLGCSAPVITRIITNHPRTKDKDKEVSVSKWRTIRRLAQDSVLDTFSDPDQLAKLKPQDRILAAGIAHDKLKDESPQQLAIDIRAKIDAMSFEELIASIPKPKTIEGEFTPLETSPAVESPLAKPPLPCPKNSPESQLDAPDIETDNE